MRNITIIASACVTLGLCGMAAADIKTFQPNTGTWHDEDNWSPTGIPTAADRAVIPAGKTCNIDSDDAIADTIVVASTGLLYIYPSYTLTLENNNNNIDSAPDDHEINGDVVMLVNPSGPPTAGGSIAFTSLDHRVDGDGTVWGDNPTYCVVSIAANIKLINRLAEAGQGMRGSMTIEGLTGTTNGKFRNEGLVEADGKGHIILASTTILEDISDAFWNIGDCFSHMTFERESLNLNGDFTHVDNGRYHFNQSVKTCGTYTRNCGWIDVGSGKTFSYVEFVDGSGSCGNPGSATGDPVTCNAPYVVSADANGLSCTE
ncbi:MAG: hypothetical protein ACKVU4_10990 [Phycisphaerales bacterium]